MRTGMLIGCFLLSISMYAQKTESLTKEIKLPNSIFVVSSLDFQSQLPIVFNHLYLTGHRFMIVDGYVDYGTNFQIDTRNLGRIISNDDLMDNYLKARLSRFDVSKNSNHFIWNMWNVNLQKQQAKIKINN